MEKLVKVVNDFVKQVEASPAQKTAEWYTLKSKTIGGSEIATVLGINPFKSVKALIAEKAGVADNVFTGNMATRWGTVFEHVTREWTELVLDMPYTIVETGSLPGIIDRQRYSPDGLGVVGLLNDEDQLEYYIVLFEFKSPFRSIPDGKIPKYYRPQIQTGLLTIPICELSIFVNNSYRKCALKDIGFNLTYDTQFHDGDLKKKLTKAQKITKIFGCGVCCFYQSVSDYNKAVVAYNVEGEECDDDKGYNKDYEKGKVREDCDDKEKLLNANYNFLRYPADFDILIKSANELIDFGSENANQLIERLFELIEQKRILVKYNPIIVNYDNVNDLEFIQTHNKGKSNSTTPLKKIIKTQMDEFLDECTNLDYMPIGYLPWKIIKSDILADHLLDDWHATIKEPIETVLNKIDIIASAPDPYEKFNELHTYVEQIDTANITDGFEFML